MALQGCGFDEDFVEAPADYLKCIICHLVLREPVQLMECGHHYCSVCFDRIRGYSSHFNSELSCPIDRQIIDLDKVLKDKFMERLVADLQVKCTFKYNGCTWVGELRNIEAHRRECPHAVKQDLSEEAQCSGGEVGITTSDFKQVVLRLESCEESLLEKDKDLAHVNFRLKEFTEKLATRDEEVETLKQKLSHNEEIKKLNLNDVEMIKNEMKELKKKCENQNTLNRNNINDIRVANKVGIDNLQQALRVRDNKIEGLKGEIKGLKKKFDETQKKTTQSDQSSNSTLACTPTVTTVTTPTVTNGQGTFIWRINLRELKINTSKSSDKFYCHSGGTPMFLDICRYLSSIELSFYFGLAGNIPETNALKLNVDIELVKEDASKERKKLLTRTFEDKSEDKSFYQYDLPEMAQDMILPFAYEKSYTENILAISCKWTCDH